MNEIFNLERQLEDRDTRRQAVGQLPDAWKRLNAESAFVAEFSPKPPPRKIPK